MQAAEEALTGKHSEPIVAAAVALAAVVSVESPFIHVATIQVLIGSLSRYMLWGWMERGMPMSGNRQSDIQCVHKASVVKLST